MTATSPRIRSCYWHRPVFGGVECVQADFRDHVFARHFHDDWSLGLVVRGANVFRYRRGVVEAPHGTVCLVEPGEVHDGGHGVRDGWAYWNLRLATAEMDRLAAEVGLAGAPEFASGCIDDAALARVFVAMFQALAADVPVLEQESRVVAALGAMIAGHATATAARPRGARREPALVGVIRDYLHAHWQDTVRLADLEQATGAGQFRLLRAFSRATGLTPQAYLTQVRVEHAKALILAGEPIAEVAAAAGFSDQAHMTRVFRRLTGLTPGSMARRSEPPQEPRP